MTLMFTKKKKKNVTHTLWMLNMKYTCIRKWPYLTLVFWRNLTQNQCWHNFLVFLLNKTVCYFFFFLLYIYVFKYLWWILTYFQKYFVIGLNPEIIPSIRPCVYSILFFAWNCVSHQKQYHASSVWTVLRSLQV